MLRPDRIGNRHARRLLVAFTLAVTACGGCARFGDDMLQITPESFSACQGTNTVVHVKWDASSVVKNGGVRLWVYKPGNTRVLWMQAGAKGEAATGRWASDGWTVKLVSDKGRLLGMRTLQTTACPSSGG